MGSLFTLFFGLIGLSSLAVPWIGAVGAYLVAILNPQSVWHWHFQDFRPALFVTLPLLVGIGIAALRGQLDWRALGNLRAACIGILLLCCTVSALFGPFGQVSSESAIMTKWYILEITTKIVLLMAVATLCSTAERPLRAFGWMIAACCAYMTYWANHAYLSVGWVYRLAGPTTLDGSGPYVDENNFAAFFVATLPFIWYMAFTLKHKLLRAAIWLIVPFAWHAIFLTGSRGGLLGMAVVLGVIVMRSGQRHYGVLLIAAFIGAFVWQAGDTMKERAASIDDYRDDESATGRLDAWKAASKMMATHPLTGVGPGAFTRAFPSFSEAFPLQAHNTYFQIGAEYGPLAAIALLTAIAASLLTLYRRGNEIARLPPSPETALLKAINEATLTGLAGLLTCTMFLSLQVFEVLYFLIFLANATDVVIGRRLAAAAGAEAATPRAAAVAGARAPSWRGDRAAVRLALGLRATPEPSARPGHAARPDRPDRLVRRERSERGDRPVHGAPSEPVSTPRTTRDPGPVDVDGLAAGTARLRSRRAVEGATPSNGRRRRG
ncbi:MAG: O-antigen ligase family protein [Burkholderiaceae bacterium]